MKDYEIAFMSMEGNVCRTIIKAWDSDHAYDVLWRDNKEEIYKVISINEQ